MEDMLSADGLAARSEATGPLPDRLDGTKLILSLCASRQTSTHVRIASPSLRREAHPLNERESKERTVS